MGKDPGEQRSTNLTQICTPDQSLAEIVLQMLAKWRRSFKPGHWEFGPIVVCQRKGTWVQSFCKGICVRKTHTAQGPYRWMTVSIRSLGNERMLGYYGGVGPYTAVSPPRAGNDRGVRANWHEADGSALS